VFLTNVVASRASCIQGRAFAATCAEVWPGGAVEAVRDRARQLRGHYAPIFGAVLSRLDIALPVAQRVFLYQVLRGLLSAAVRLGIVGPYAAQRLQLEAAEVLEEVLAACATLRDRDIAQTAPILDLLHAGHDRLYSRLFQS
jgi:urease accessory protein